MTPEQWKIVKITLSKVFDEKIAGVFAATEIQDAHIMRKREQPFFFLRMFGFDSPEAVLENDKEQKNVIRH
jgi:hypothetical protein